MIWGGGGNCVPHSQTELVPHMSKSGRALINWLIDWLINWLIDCPIGGGGGYSDLVPTGVCRWSRQTNTYL